jgi:pimeloyl-ACP methyl ester carboxylesterase
MSSSSNAGLAVPTKTGTVRTRDGRSIHLTSWGAADGRVILVQPHVGSSGRFESPVDVEPLAFAGIQLVRICRAGIGPSDRRADRTRMSDAEDMLAVADALRIEKASLLGECGGTGATLAFAARWPNRVQGIALLSSVAPFDGPGSDEYMTKTLRSWRSVHRYRLVAERAVRSQQRGYAEDPDGVMARGRAALPEVDRLMAEEDGRVAAGRAAADEFLGSLDGCVDEWRALTHPWHVPLDAVRSPVLIDHGLLDTVAPIGMARWLHRRLANSTLEVDPDRGHYVEPDHLIDLVHRLLAAA